MVDFSEMAKAAKARSQEIVDAEDHRKRMAQDAEDQRLALAAEVLRDKVLPIVKQAAIAFAADGIDLGAREAGSFRTPNTRGCETKEIRTLVIECSSKLPNDGPNTRVIRGGRFIFEHDGDSLTWKRESASGSGKRFTGGTFEEFVTPALLACLEAYYEVVRARS